MLCSSSFRQKKHNVFCQFLCNKICVYSCQQINKKDRRNWQYAKLSTRAHCVTVARKEKDANNTDSQTKMAIYN